MNSPLKSSHRTASENELWYRAIQEWIAKNPNRRRHLVLGDLTAVEFAEIFSIVNEYKYNGVEP